MKISVALLRKLTDDLPSPTIAGEVHTLVVPMAVLKRKAGALAVATREQDILDLRAEIVDYDGEQVLEWVVDINWR